MSAMVSVAALQDEVACGHLPQLIDVRTASEYASGHIPCALNIPMDQFEARRKDLRLEQGVVLVCKAGGRAKIVAATERRTTSSVTGARLSARVGSQLSRKEV